MGCLTLPFRLIGALLVVLLLVGAWLYRDQLLEVGRGAAGHRAPAAAVGVPSPAALGRARTALARLRAGADSVVLDPDESAALLGQAIGPAMAGQLDSLRIRLSDGRVAFTASLRTARLPRELLGPLAIAVRRQEPIAAAGAVQMRKPGLAEWDIDRMSVRDIPLPREAVPRVIARAFGDSSRRALPLALPQSVQDLRIRPAGVTLYARPSR
jgi:hypothetical protein